MAYRYDNGFTLGGESIGDRQTASGYRGAAGIARQAIDAPAQNGAVREATAAVAAAGPAPTDPQYGKQWHLAKLGDMNTIWADYTGAGIKVGVYDSGVQYDHADLDGNYDASLELTIAGVRYDGDYRPESGGHGTSVAGLIAAERNGSDTVGVAYGASITGVNIFDQYSGGGTNPGIFINAGDPTLFLEAMRDRAKFDVVNDSWGLTTATYGSDESRGVVGTRAYLVAQTIEYAAVTGRGGLGTISVNAAGNTPYDSQADSSHTVRHWISVGAYREVDGLASNFSAQGDGLLVSAPSNDFAILGGTGIVTTDLLGRDGYNTIADPGGKYDFTDQFGGTSAASPIVAGVVALMLDANEGLGWRDVQNILASSAKMPIAYDNHTRFLEYTDAQGTSVARMNEDQFKIVGKDNTTWNGGGLHHSRDYGYGAVDAFAAVRMSEAWSLFGDAQTSANELHVRTAVLKPEMVVVPQGELIFTDSYTDFSYTPSSFRFRVGATGLDVENVDMTISYSTFLDFGEPYGANLAPGKLKLIAPDGTFAFVDTLGSGAGLNTLDVQSFTFGFHNFRGAKTEGVWTLQAEQGYLTNMTIHTVQLDLYGAESSVNDVYTYTDEFATMAAIDGEAGRHTLKDANGGVDWINAAAVTSDVTLSLAAGSTTMFGDARAFRITSGTRIENVVTGDGDDRITGSSAANHLVGMRGDDVLVGGGGNDTLDGGAGRDIYSFSINANTGDDTLVSFTRDDVIAFNHTRGRSIEIGADGILQIDRTAEGDTIALGTDHPDALVYLGRLDGQYVYGESVAPEKTAGHRVVSSLIGSEVLNASSVKDVFFFDTDGPVQTGTDLLVGFDSRDILVTTSAIAGVNADGRVSLDPSGFLDLPDQGGAVAFSGTSPSQLEFDGSVVRDGTSYFVYSLVGSGAGVADLGFGVSSSGASDMALQQAEFLLI